MSDREIPLPPANFEFLVLSLRMQAEMQMGLFGESGDGQEPDLRLARHTIDLMACLQEKTKGNLSLEQQRLLDNSVTELRFRYVQAAEERQAKPAEPKAGPEANE
jgi:ABC-type sulfate/molybdate transport systems ATPase subunit